MAMWRTNLHQNLTTILGQQKERNFPYCTLGQMWFLTAGPLMSISVFFAEFFQVVELQACHRVFAPSRRGQDRERRLVLPRLFALLRWPLPPLWGSWISAESPFRLSSNPFCSACALMLQSQPRILVPLEFLKWRCPGFNRRVKRSFIRMFELLLCGRVFLGARFRLVSSPQTWERTDCAHEVHTLEQLFAKDPFFPDFFWGATRPWRI